MALGLLLVLGLGLPSCTSLCEGGNCSCYICCWHVRAVTHNNVGASVRSHWVWFYKFLLFWIIRFRVLDRSGTLAWLILNDQQGTPHYLDNNSLSHLPVKGINSAL